MAELNKTALEIQQLRQQIVEAQKKIGELEAQENEQGWYVFSEKNTTESYYFNMINGYVHEMIIFRQGYVIRKVNGIDTLMANIDAWYTNESYEGCFRNSTTQFIAAAEAISSTPTFITALSGSMNTFRDKCLSQTINHKIFN